MRGRHDGNHKKQSKTTASWRKRSIGGLGIIGFLVSCVSGFLGFLGSRLGPTAFHEGTVLNAPLPSNYIEL